MPARDLQLAAPITYKFKHGLAVQREIALLPGVYKGMGEDGKGTWYLGNRESMTITVLDRGGAFGYPKEQIGVPTFSSGGLFVPHDAGLVPQVFHIYGEQPLRTPGQSQAEGKQEDSRVPADVAVNAQAANPVLSSGSPVAAGVGAGVAAGIVAGLIEMDKADWGKYQIIEFQPPPETDLRKQFTITTKQ